MSTFTPFGPGTITIGAEPGTEFSGEVLGGRVTHEYEEIGEKRTMLSGDIRGATESRTDGLTFELENDLTAAGLYAYCQTNDGTEVPFTYTPNTAAGAAWAGTIKVRLPGEVGADEFGAPIVSTVEWAGTGKFTFTPATTTP